MKLTRKNKSPTIAHLGPIKSGNMLDSLILHEDYIVQKRMAGFRVTKDDYPVAGARAYIEHEQSGMRGRQHMITVTVTLGDGGQIVLVQQETGGDGLKAVAAARRFAADVNRIGAQ